ncbi:hypothetical protein AMATHDRAFT_148545 [Amanita thiersii Skay4041]|uniref:Uncharacterized protein n=1 Tax=Amanita thiersii Skay4041 TaxID=703135 RepID=A0A2A9NL62_9AGAR|nr:hypothetical protein AMATHDRAFT_148545 [Amanita thiersii Skay4041]
MENTTLVPESDEAVPSSSDTDDMITVVSEPITPFTMSGDSSPVLLEHEPLPSESVMTTNQKKKKKKKSKKHAKAKEASTAAAAAAAKSKVQETSDTDRPPILCISRNKHWRYISSYHGPWLQLPLELLDSLLRLNSDPATLIAAEPRMQALPVPNPILRTRDRGFHSLGENHPPSETSRHAYASPSTLTLPPTLPLPKTGGAIPPPIDPGVFRCVTSIRRLIDEAAELSVRASSGLSAAELGSMRSGGAGLGSSPWATTQSLGLNPLGNNGGGRSVAMSAMRIHRLRALAVQKLAQAYKADEIASSVMVMQGGSVFDDVAERVLKADPDDIDAKYVHFFHEKIPSRQLAESTTTTILDELIAAQPQRLEFYRTRGIVHCFRDEYPQATKDFTYALKEARVVRKAKMFHRSNGAQSETRPSKTKKRKGCAGRNGQAPPDGTGPIVNAGEGPDGEPLPLHPSVLPDAPDPIEPQLLFLRGAAYLQQAVHMIESIILALEGLNKVPSIDGAELRLSAIENGKYGGVEIGNLDGPLGSRNGEKLRMYRKVLAEAEFREQVTSHLKKSIRDHDKFLSHFESIESPDAIPDGDLAQQTEYAFLLSESIRPGNHPHHPPPSTDAPAVFTTYHPLLVESHFSILICYLMLAEFRTILPTFVKTAAVVDGLEGYPVFLPPRSMGQAEFIEVLERLASGWRNGTLPHSLSSQRGKGRLAIEAAPPPVIRSVSSPPSPSGDDAQGASSSFSAVAGNHQWQGEGSSSSTGMENGHEYPEIPLREDAAEALDYARILLAPVVRRQKEKSEKTVSDKVGTTSGGAGIGGGGGKKKKPVPINIPLHGPRVEIVLAWLAAVHLPEMDG